MLQPGARSLAPSPAAPVAAGPRPRRSRAENREGTVPSASPEGWPDGGLSRYTGIVYLRRVIRSFADETTRDLFSSVNSKAARGIPNTAWRAAQRKLKQLDLVATLDALNIPPENDLHALKGDQAGRHAIRVNDQYRITFRWEGHDAFDVRCEDYH